jgi:hypothetical protein
MAYGVTGPGAGELLVGILSFGTMKCGSHERLNLSVRPTVAGHPRIKAFSAEQRDGKRSRVLWQIGQDSIVLLGWKAEPVLYAQIMEQPLGLDHRQHWPDPITLLVIWAAAV